MKIYTGLPGSAGTALSRAKVINKTQLQIEKHCVDNAYETEPFIIVADELTPEDTNHINKEHLRGFITEKGGTASHLVIYAKSLGIPALVGVKGILDDIRDGQSIYINGNDGYAIIEPDEAPET